MPGTNYRIKIVKPDFELEAEGDKDFVLQMLKRFEATSGRRVAEAKRKDAAVGDPPGPRLAASDKSLSVGEFVRKTGLKKHTDLVLAFGYYLEKYSGAASFTAADINGCYYDAKMESSNTSQMITRNIRKARFMPAKKRTAKGKKAYVVTRTGVAHIEAQLTRHQK